MEREFAVEPYQAPEQRARLAERLRLTPAQVRWRGGGRRRGGGRGGGGGAGGGGGGGGAGWGRCCRLGRIEECAASGRRWAGALQPGCATGSGARGRDGVCCMWGWGVRQVVLKSVSLTPQVKTWFQNRRIKYKKTHGSLPPEDGPLPSPADCGASPAADAWPRPRRSAASTPRRRSARTRTPVERNGTTSSLDLDLSF